MKQILQVIYTYFPFKPTTHSDGGSTHTEWGQTDEIILNDFDYNRTDLFDKFKNFNGFPLRIIMFPRYPTAVKVNELPSTFVNSYMMNETWRSDGYGGVDGLMLANAAKMLNFTTINVAPTGTTGTTGLYYGYKSDNGTFIGEMKREKMKKKISLSLIFKFSAHLFAQDRLDQCCVAMCMFHLIHASQKIMVQTKLNTHFPCILINYALLHRKRYAFPNGLLCTNAFIGMFGY